VFSLSQQHQEGGRRAALSRIIYTAHVGAVPGAQRAIYRTAHCPQKIALVVLGSCAGAPATGVGASRAKVSVQY